MKVSNQNGRKENKKSDIINNLEEDKEGCLPLVVGFKEKKKERRGDQRVIHVLDI